MGSWEALKGVLTPLVCIYRCIAWCLEKLWEKVGAVPAFLMACSLC